MVVKVGFLRDALGRLWLREVQGGVWSNTRYEIIATKDVDALAEEREGDRINLYVAEIKRTLKRDDVKKIEETIDVLKDYAVGRKSIEKTVKSIRIKALWVIDFSKGPKLSIEDELRKRLTNRVEQEIHFIYLDKLKESCMRAERVGHRLLKSIELLEGIGVIGYGRTA
jgi:hypothetical protein